MIKHGIDVGGTAIKYGACNANGEIVTRYSVPTPVGQGAEAVIVAIASCALELINAADAKPESIGVAFPGVIHDGRAFNCPNVPGFHNRHILPELESQIGIRVVLENDANAAAMAEARFGSGRDHPDFLYVTLGTGVGGGVVRNGLIERGPYGDAGEVGHIYVGDDVMESVVGAPALRKAVGGGLDVHDIDLMARSGEPLAIEILENAGKTLGRALCSALAVLGMRVIVLGGGISRSDIIIETARLTIKTHAIPSIAEHALVVRARFLENTGLVGACMLVE